MNGLSGFDAIAAARGDGLLPEFRRLMLPPAGNVVELSAFRRPSAVHAGPAPRPRDVLADVVPFGPEPKAARDT